MTHLPASPDTTPPPAPKTLSGVLERLTYQNEETGYTVARLLPDRKLPSGEGAPPASTLALQGSPEERLITVVGTLLGVVAGEALELTGFWQRHKEHGWQFLVLSYRTVLPATTQGLRKYLGSGLIKGIGPKTAEKIIAQFDVGTLDILEQHPERLLEVPGLGPHKVQRITAAWEEQKAIKAVMLCLQDLNVSTSLAVRIYKQYGDAAIGMVKHQPYLLAREVWGIGFKTADKIAQAQGYTLGHPERLKAGVLFALWEASENDGHTWLPRAALARQAAKLLGVEPEQVEPAITSLLQAGEVQGELLVTGPTGQTTFAPLPTEVEHPGMAAPEEQASFPSTAAGAAMPRSEASLRRARTAPMSDAHAGWSGEPLVALPPFAAAEYGIARNLLRLAACPPARGHLADLQQTNFAVMFDYLTTKAQLPLAERQRDGIKVALTKPVSILTGGPGTGKTTSLRALIRVLTLKQKQVILAAPTGRAAKRLAEATGLEAKTLHRLLQLRPGSQSVYDQANPLQADMVIVDEVSMLDTLLMNTLLKAIATGTHLLLVGDADQLPSVGAGNVLADLISSGGVPVVRLEQIFRQRAGSQIALAAQRINQGLLPQVGSTNAEFFFFRQEEAEATGKLVIELVAERIPAKFGVRPEDIQVLSPMHRGHCGVGELNRHLQTVLNPPGSHKAERFHGGTCFRVGDKVLQLRNNYDKEVFNGDSGTIIGISLEEQTVTVRLDDERRVSYEFSELDELMLAYTLSIHKAQGSEYPVCVVPLAMEQYLLLERQLIYTAVTRARQLVVLVGSKRALTLAVRNGPSSAASMQTPGGSAPLRTLATTLTRGWTGRSTGLAIRLRQLARTGEAGALRP